MSAQIALQGSEIEMRELVGGTKESNTLLDDVIDLPPGKSMLFYYDDFLDRKRKLETLNKWPRLTCRKNCVTKQTCKTTLHTETTTKQPFCYYCKEKMK